MEKPLGSQSVRCKSLPGAVSVSFWKALGWPVVRPRSDHVHIRSLGDTSYHRIGGSWPWQPFYIYRNDCSFKSTGRGVTEMFSVPTGLTSFGFNVGFNFAVVRIKGDNGSSAE